MTKRQNGSRVACKTGRLQSRRLNSRPRRLRFDNPGMKDPGEIPPTQEKLLIDATDALRSTFSQCEQIPDVSRRQAETIWRAIDADVLPDAEVSMWCRIVAKRIVNEVLGFDPTKTRKSGQAVQAIYLQGRSPTALTVEEGHDLVCFKLARALDHLLKRRIGALSPYDLADRMQSRGHFKNKSLGAVAELLRREMQRR
jgi:hypothetical protein